MNKLEKWQHGDEWKEEMNSADRWPGEQKCEKRVEGGEDIRKRGRGRRRVKELKLRTNRGVNTIHHCCSASTLPNHLLLLLNADPQLILWITVAFLFLLLGLSRSHSAVCVFLLCLSFSLYLVIICCRLSFISWSNKKIVANLLSLPLFCHLQQLLWELYMDRNICA